MKDGSGTEFVPQMKKMYTVDPGVVDSLDWFILLAGAAGTIMSTAALVYWFWKLITFLIKVSAAKTNFNNKRFWRNMLVSLLIIFLFISGSLMMLVSQIFKFMSVWGWSQS